MSAAAAGRSLCSRAIFLWKGDSEELARNALHFTDDSFAVRELLFSFCEFSFELLNTSLSCDFDARTSETSPSLWS